MADRERRTRQECLALRRRVLERSRADADRVWEQIHQAYADLLAAPDAPDVPLGIPADMAALLRAWWFGGR